MNEYSDWFYNEGWFYISALGAYLGWTIGMKAYFIIVPLVAVAIAYK